MGGRGLHRDLSPDPAQLWLRLWAVLRGLNFPEWKLADQPGTWDQECRVCDPAAPQPGPIRWGVAGLLAFLVLSLC